MTPLKGKSALVTGSNAGLGLAIAQGLAAAGCDIVLHGLEPHSEAASRLKASYVRCDLAEPQGAERLAEAAGQVDILVNNAVVRHFAPIESFPMAQWQRALAVNLTAAFRLVQLVLPGMRSRGWGRVVNLTSVYGTRATANRVDYVTTKSALLGFTRAVAVETVADGITCNAVTPGTVLTPGIESRVTQMTDAGVARDEAERRVLQGKQPTGRFVQAQDVAALVVFLCSPAARDITGVELPMEGGWLAG
jgi:3-hydroxybutyrate dehydrogenase